MDGIKELKDKTSLFSFNQLYEEDRTKNYGLKLKVNQTGILEMDENVVHPFVRVHIVDLQNNKWLGKSTIMQPGVANKESLSYFKYDKDKGEKEALKNVVDFFLPMSTKMYDLRVKGVNYCEWNEEFVINEKITHLMDQKVVFMFEILDFCPHLIVKDKNNQLNSEKLYPVAWGYLRPLGTSSIHIEKVKL